MIQIYYSKVFIKKLARLDPHLQDEVVEKVELFKNLRNHKQLKVHKLQKPFSGVYAFSVNYKVCILFEYKEKKKKVVLLLTLGGHDVYKR